MAIQVVPAVLAFLQGKFVKVLLVIGLFTVLTVSATYTLKWFNNKLIEAKQAGIDSVVIEQNEDIIRNYEQQLEQEQLEKADLQQELANSNVRMEKLRKQLLIEHDLDRLLQSKPDMITNRVNKGTEEVFRELEGVIYE